MEVIHLGDKTDGDRRALCLECRYLGPRSSFPRSSSPKYDLQCPNCRSTKIFQGGSDNLEFNQTDLGE